MLLELEKDWETMLRLTSVSSRKSKIHIVEYIYTHSHFLLIVVAWQTI